MTMTRALDPAGAKRLPSRFPLCPRCGSNQALSMAGTPSSVGSNSWIG